MKKIAVIGANAPLEPFYRHAKNLGYYIVGIAWDYDAICKKYCDKFYPISFTDKDAVLEVCKNENVDGITSFSLESALPTVIYVSQKLGLTSNNEDCLQLTVNKYTMRNAFKDAKLPVPAYYLIKDIKELNGINLQYPVIVKPVDSGGSQGVTKVDNDKDLVASYNFAKSCSRTKTVIIEDFIDGREFSVEYLSYKGKHYFMQVTDKVTSGAPHFIEMQHHQPADISEEIKKEIQSIVERALTSLKIENSPSHTEIKINSKGEIYIIEIGPRMGGDYITSDLVRLSTGYNMVKGALEIATNSFEIPVIQKNKFSGVYFYSKLAKHIGEIIRNHKNYNEIVECEISDTVLHDVHSNADRNGYLLYQSDNIKINF